METKEIEKALKSFKTEMEKKEKRQVLNFGEYLALVRKEPERTLRNVFQLFRDMVKSYVGEGKSEYPEDPENIIFKEYDHAKLFEEGVENPFFADRLFANRFIRKVELMTLGAQQNRIYVFKGSHGCGKSTFLNNLLQKFQEYTGTKEGQSFEIFWDIEIDDQKVEIPCPSHDHPILIIPGDYQKDYQNYRTEFLEQLLPAGEIKEKIFGQKEYRWLFQQEACAICNSLFWALFEKFGDIDKVLSSVKVRPYRYDRRLGEGIVVFNPGDKPLMTPMASKAVSYSADQRIQDRLDQIFGPNRVKYTHSLLAKTNNGIYVLMDIKFHNKERLLDLQNVISEEVWRVGEIEERIKSIFLASMIPEDLEQQEKEEIEKLFQGRIEDVKMPYVLDPQAEVKIYRTAHGQQIDSYFLPRVLENYARIIISSRMNQDCPALKEWLKNPNKYEKRCDESGLLLRMEIYSGNIPSWLSEEDKKNLTLSLKRKLITYAEEEGEKGFTGRDSLLLFRDFFSRFRSNSKLITMDNVADFFKYKIDKRTRDENIPRNFIDSLVNWYDYGVVREVKEALYFHNEKKISEDVLHFLTAVNYKPGAKARCSWTDKEVAVTMDFLKEMAARITGDEYDDEDAIAYAQGVQQKYTQIVARGQEKEIIKTKLYQELFAAYVKNLEKKALQPFVTNKSFLEAVKAFGTEKFEIFEGRLKEHVTYMIKNLIKKFGYTEQGAKEICLYVIDKKLAEKFSE